MISWGTIFYGATLSGVLAVVAALILLRERRPHVLALVAVSAMVGPIGWNAVLHTAGNADFFHDAPIAIFPVSWQDCGSGVWALAAASVAQGSIQTSARRALLLAVVTAVVAWLVDIYLY